MNINDIFINPEEQRLRAGWRLLIQTFILIVLATGVVVIFGVAAFFLPIDKSIPFEWLLFATQVAELFVVSISVYLARRFLDKRSFTSLGLKRNTQAIKDLLAGLVITFFMISLVFLLERKFGWLQVQGFAWNFETTPSVITNSLLTFLIYILVGWSEELLSRGYHLQTLASGLGLTRGILISSIVFGILHYGNPNATWIGLAGIFLAGVFLAYAYVRTGQLWLSIGLHIGWNYFEGVVFGFPVSGMETFTITHIHVNGPQIITGGAFGPEAGLIILPALLLGVIMIYGYTRKRYPVRT